MELFMYVFIFILGLIFGSFFNVCIYRIPLNEDIFISRSKCFSCGKNLGALDMVPVLSYIFLGGKCRYCKSKVSLRYPLIELLTAVLFCITYYRTGLNINLVVHLLLVSLLIIIAFIDLDHLIIPHSLTITGMFIALGWQLYSGSLAWTSMILGFGIGFGMPGIIALFGGMGGGDVMLGGMFGLFLGFKYTLTLLMISFIIGGIYSIFMLATKKKKGKEMVAFGPFLVIAGLIVLWYGAEILTWYGVSL